MAKRALLVGCNYPGTENALDGCVNDVMRVKEMLLTRFGFQERNIVVMIDTDKKYTQPTGANIRKGLNKIVMNTDPGDVLFMHFSGHGVQVPAESGIPDDTGFDECIVPTDMNLLTDDDFREIVNKVPEGVTLTIVSDSCHSGGLIDHAKEQIGNSTLSTSRIASREFHLSTYRAPRGAGGYNTSKEFHFPKQNDEGSTAPRGYGERQVADNRGDHHHSRHTEHRSHEAHHETHRTVEHHNRPRSGGHTLQDYVSSTPPNPETHVGYSHAPHPAYGTHESHNPAYVTQNYGSTTAHYVSAYGGSQAPAGEGWFESTDENTTHGNTSHAVSQENRTRTIKNRGLSVDSFMSMLGQKAGTKVVEGGIRTTLYSIFGKDSSPKVQMFVGVLMKHGPAIIAHMSGKGEGSVVGLLSNIAIDFIMGQAVGSGIQAIFSHATPIAQEAAQSNNDGPLLAGYKPSAEGLVREDMGILISGCQAKETSSDTNPNGNPKEAYGALSNCIQTIVEKRQGRITVKELVTEAQAMLAKQNYNQHPGLYCSDSNVNAPFVCD